MITKYPHPAQYCFETKSVMLQDKGLIIPAKAIKYGYEQGDEKLSEAAVQQRIFIHHWNTYPEERGFLYHNNNNSVTRKKGAILKGLGVVAGVADLTYLYATSADDWRFGGTAFLEVKLPGSKQSKKQIEWQDKVEGLGLEYYIIRSIADFEAVRGELVR